MTKYWKAEFNVKMSYEFTTPDDVDEDGARDLAFGTGESDSPEPLVETFVQRQGIRGEIDYDDMDCSIHESGGPFEMTVAVIGGEATKRRAIFRLKSATEEEAREEMKTFLSPFLAKHHNVDTSTAELRPYRIFN